MPPAVDYTWQIGERVPRLDVREKVLGYGQYPDDVYIDGMCHASAVRSKYPRAKVLSIDTSAAKALPGVVGVFTSEDIPGDKVVGHIMQDWDVMIPVGGITHFLGDVIAVVAAETLDIVEKAKKLVKVEYEELTPITSPYEAMAEDAPKLHPNGNLLAHKHVGSLANSLAVSDL